MFNKHRITKRAKGNAMYCCDDSGTTSDCTAEDDDPDQDQEQPHRDGGGSKPGCADD
jgi:hypothetical protein